MVDDFSTYGTVSGSIYTCSNTFCEETGYVVMTITITLTSETTATGTVSWTYYGTPGCTGGHQLTLSKQSQSDPVYDASGKWNFTQSGFSSNCGSPNTPDSEGYFNVTQTGNKITALDNKGRQYTGFVNGAEYAVVRSYLDKGGRTTEWSKITLISATEGSGQAHFVWDDDCDDCDGDWNISVTKDLYTISATATAGGTISPSGSITIDGGASQEFQINADSGYVISDVLVDDSSVGAVSPHTFSDVSEYSHGRYTWI